MKAVILAAGKGTRMIPLTNEVPKVLIEINGRPFLYYVMKNLEKAGYDDLCLVVGYKKEMVSEFLVKYGFNAVIVEQKEQKGTGDAVMKAKDFVSGDNFVVLGGDNLWSADDLKEIAKDDDLNYISGIKVSNPSKYGVLVGEEGMLKEIKEKPKEDFGNLVNTGLYKFTPEIFDALDSVKLSLRGELELTDAISMLASEGKVRIIKIKDFWKDLGSLDDIKPMKEFLKRWKD